MMPEPDPDGYGAEWRRGREMIGVVHSRKRQIRIGERRTPNDDGGRKKTALGKSITAYFYPRCNFVVFSEHLGPLLSEFLALPGKGPSSASNTEYIVLIREKRGSIDEFVQLFVTAYPAVDE